MTSVCGFISRNDSPYSVYYALIHNTSKDRFVRLSISIGDWWKHDSYRNRYAVCLDVTPAKKTWRFRVVDPMYSPQQNLAKFGQWLGTQESADSAQLDDLMEVADFVATHDPAVLTYLTGRPTDYTGREAQRPSNN